jgi:hypothetical protein
MGNADVSADGANAQLLTGFPGKPIIDLAMPRYRSLRAVRWIHKDRVTATFPRHTTSVPPK